MADKQIKTEPQLLPIEQHQHTNKTPLSVFAGIKAMQSWPSGKQVSTEEYRSAATKFLKKKAGERNA